MSFVESGHVVRLLLLRCVAMNGL